MASKATVAAARNNARWLYDLVGPSQRYLILYHACETRSPINAVAVVEAVIRGKTADQYFADKIAQEWDVVLNCVQKEEEAALAALLRHLFGNPFHPAAIDPAWLAWNYGTVRRIAQGIYDEKTFGHLPILADALEEAGCKDSSIIDHCRNPGDHFRGCWLIDLLLGKQ